MRIKIWGCRGSLPTPEQYAIRYGGNTTCVEVRLADDTLIIIDAGSGIRKLGNSLMKDSSGPLNFHLYLTHAHWDHLMGFPFFVPAYIKSNSIHVKGGPLAKRDLQQFLSHQMAGPYFPIDFRSMKAKFDFTSGKPKERKIANAEIVPIALNHPNGGYGCKITENGKSFIFLTDNELGFRHPGGLSQSEYVNFCSRSDLLFHDAQYTDQEYKNKKTWGHSTYADALFLAMSARVKRLGLFHHDPDRTDDDLDVQVDICRSRIEKENRKVECFGVAEGQEFTL